MKDGPAFQTYADLFYIDTVEWDIAEIGLYWRLLLLQWTNGSISSDPKVLQKLTQTSSKRFTKVFQKVSKKFVIDGDGRLINLKLEEVRQKQRQYREMQAEKGKNSAKKRWGKNITGVITTVEPMLQPTHQPNCNSSSSSLSLNNKQYICEVFQFWKEIMNHPKAILDKKRERKIETQLKTGRTIEECKKAIEGCKNSAWHMGSNDRQKIFDSIDLIFRDAEHFESFLSQQPKKTW